jgi:large subunit ribosomal protein L4
MQLDVVNHENKKVGTVDVNDEVFGGRINTGLIWESVVHANAKDRSGTHAAKTRAFVSGTGKKPWKQKGTGRAQVGSSRTPLWRHGGTTHPPRPRSYDFKLSKKVELGALRSALSEKLKAGEVIIVDALGVSEPKTKAAVELLKRLGVTGKAVLVDVAADDTLARSVRNIPGVALVQSARLTARDVLGAGRVVATRGALEKLQEALAS